jgi:2TM domain
MKNYNNKNDAYSRARYKVDRIRGFYKHLAAYIIINSLILGIKIIKDFNFGDSNFDLWVDINIYGIWFFWGIGLAFHAFSVFGVIPFFGKNWEENKIKKYMEEEEYNIKSNNE